MRKLNRLSQELINQIAAGEVVERPASVVKELVDNAIDANATQIKVRIKNGGMSLIEASDNGFGIEKDNLLDVFLPHTTSKISKLEDLSNIQTMGFRGEALSTISSVANVEIVSKNENEDFAYQVKIEKDNKVSKGARDTGTTISISNLFYNTPARLKFMKSESTEYRKVLEVLTQYAIVYPNIHFVLENDSKVVFNLPPSSDKERVKSITKKDFVDRMIEVKSEGAGVKISGYIGHPSDAKDKGLFQYIFVNNRPIWDNGVSKSVHQGYSRFIPHMFKVPFIIKLDVDGSMVDVNVHPRKEEVKFINPYRIYSAIEEAVSTALQNVTKEEYQPQSISQSSFFDTSTIRYEQSSNNIKEIRFDKKPSDFNISKSIDFSKQVLNFQQSQPTRIDEKMTFGEFRNVFQIFNKYIVVEFESDLWMIDQHAAAERINFEKLTKQYEGKINDVQRLMLPVELSLNEHEKSYLNENLNFFTKLGFEIEVDDNLTINAVPVHLAEFSIEEIFTSIFEMSEETRDLSINFEKKKQDIFATIACHGSVRAGQKLSIPECVSIYNELGKCDNPYSCPHGRPAVWKMKLTDIDTNFYRTY